MIFLKECNLSALFIWLFLFTGCNDNAVNLTRTTSFYPLVIGNTWNYDYKTYDSLAAVMSVLTMREALSATRMKNDSLVYEIDSPLHPPKSGALNETYYYQNKTDGVHFLKSSDPSGYWISDNLLYKYPVSENGIYINAYVYNDTTFVVSLNDTVICAAGKFNCITYKNIYKDFRDSANIRVIGYSYTYCCLRHR
jgi:hypothetical protein